MLSFTTRPADLVSYPCLAQVVSSTFRWLLGLTLLLASVCARAQVVIDQGPAPAPASVTVPQAQWGLPTEYSLTFPYQGCGNMTSLRVEVGLDTGPDHAIDAGTLFSTTQQVTVSASIAGNSSVAPATSTTSLTIARDQSRDQPEHWRLLDVSSIVGANTGNGTLVIKVSVPGQASTFGAAPSTQRVVVRCVPEYHTFDAANLVILPDAVRPTTGYEQTLSWKRPCPFVANYQIQLLFRPVNVSRRAPKHSSTDPRYDPVASPTEGEWQLSGSLLETGSANFSYQLSLAEGEGTYHWRVRAIGNQLPGGVTNPGNWGPWGEGTPFDVTAPDAADNWIYSRSFSEGGHMAEKLTFANGLQQVRQMQTRLTTPTQSTTSLGQQVVASQTVQDYAGRDAVTSLPIPLQGASANALGFRQELLTDSNGAAYDATQFDLTGSTPASNTAREPLPANEQGYYSGTNDRVADAEGYPFTRTVFSNDGTNRVVEQGGVGDALRVRATGAHTVRTTYTSVAPEEVIRLFGPEAPEVEGLYKVVTTDPNNIISVTYQGKDGKTIATALAAGESPTTLQDLPSAGARQFITEAITSKGQIVSKTLTLTNTSNLTVSYSITPTQLQSACASNYCSTCDYQVLMRVVDANAEPGSAPLASQTIVVKASEQCNVGSLAVPNIAISGLSPGTYRIERELVPVDHYPTTAATTSVGPSSTTRTLTQHLFRLQATLKSKFASGAPWANMATYLAASDVAGLYTYLDGLNYPREDHNGQDCYKILVPGCDDYIYFPRLTDYCPALPNLTNPSFEADLQAALDALNQQYNVQYTAASLLPGFAPTQFNKLVANMDTATIKAPPGSPTNRVKLYDSGKLANCWQGMLANLEPLLYKNLGGAAGYSFNLGREYLQCTGVNLLYPISTVNSPVPFDPTQAYQQFLYDPGDIGQVNCLLAAGVDTTTSPPTVPQLNVVLGSFKTYSAYRRNQVFDCLQYLKSATASGTYTPGGNNTTTLTPADAQTQAAQLTQQAQQTCETRRTEFRRVLLLQLHQQGQYVQGDVYAWTPGTNGIPTITATPLNSGTALLPTCQVEAMVQRLVEQCQHDVQLTATPVTSNGTTYYQIGTMAEVALAQQAMFSQLSVSVNTSGGCPANLPAPVLPWSPVIQNANPGAPLGAPNVPHLTITTTARDLLTNIALLTTGVNQLSQQPNHTPLGCSGVLNKLDEKQQNVFSVTTVLSNWSFGKTNPVAGEPDTYATLLDDRYGQSSTHSAYNYSTDYVLVTDRDATNNRACTATPAAGFPTSGSSLLLDVAKAVGQTNSHYYWLRFVSPVSNQVFTKASILSISAPYIKFFPSMVNSGAVLTGTNSLGVTVGLLVLDPITHRASWQEAIIQTTDVIDCEGEGCGGNEGTGDQVIVWKQVDPTLTQGDCPAPLPMCYAWSTQMMGVTAPPAGFPVFNPQPEPCNKVVARGLLATLSNEQDRWVDAQITAFTTQFQNKCVALAGQQEAFTVGYQLGYHHFTLYYYDRAGNLMKTVPPAGVAPLTTAQVAACLPPNTTSPAPSRSTWPVPMHRLATTYVYNSLHQLEKQSSRDGGETHFFYNLKGQLRFSQNARQRTDATPSYSYTRYDALGRVTEVGETTTDATNGSATGDAELRLARTKLEDMSYPPTTAIRQVTRTVYGGSPVVSYLGQPQRYLTNRVSYSYYDVDGNTRTQADNSYTYYSYDPHGNVEWLGQYQPQAELRVFEEESGGGGVIAVSPAITQLASKFVRYEYDLVSNKVTKVLYQEGQQDQFYHRYGYDGDNRMTLVETSSDGQHWEQDARYTYFAHGPLKRLELGEDHVQGIDYTYTLQGWLKGLNHPGLDPGSDGAGTGLTASAKDAFGMALGYYQGDYVTQNAAWQNGSSSVLQPQYSLYNGNIAAWTTKTRDDVATIRATPSEGPVGEQYRYDALNRITSSSFSRFALGGGSPTATQDYATGYVYDANGNLSTLTRNGNASVSGQPLAMDQLSYHYDTTNERDNRLLRVNDAAPDAYTDDIKFTQATTDQYVYDAIGNLIQDLDPAGSVVKNITWNCYGKISQVQQSNGILVRYHYDALGNRIRKSFSSNNGSNWRHVYYVRDAQGNVLAVYEQTEVPRAPRRPTDSPTILGTMTLTEQPLYGSSRLGERKLSLALTAGAPASDAYQRVLQKQYELTDHLGNVRALVGDAKRPDVAGTFKPDLLAYFNYYPFGMLQPNRNGPGTTSLAGGYRYGYNGKEQDNNGELGLTSYDYGFRIYNPGIGRFFSEDPLTKIYPELTPYQYASNTPVQAIDLDGLEAVRILRVNSLDLNPKLDRAKLKPSEWYEVNGYIDGVSFASAAIHNLLNTNSGAYKTISERTEFYEWYQQAIDAKGFQVKWAGAATKVAVGIGMLAGYLPKSSMNFSSLMKALNYTSDDAIKFANEGNEAIFNDALPKLKALYLGPVLTGDKARAFDAKMLSEEQNLVQPLYEKQSSANIGLVSAGAKQLLFLASTFAPLPAFPVNGSMLDAKQRWSYGMTNMGYTKSQSAPSAMPAPDPKYLPKDK